MLGSQAQGETSSVAWCLIFQQILRNSVRRPPCAEGGATIVIGDESLCMDSLLSISVMGWIVV